VNCAFIITVHSSGGANVAAPRALLTASLCMVAVPCISCRYPGSQGKQYFLGLEAVLGGSGDPAYPGGYSSCVGGEVHGLKQASEVKMQELKLWVCSSCIVGFCMSLRRRQAS